MVRVRSVAQKRSPSERNRSVRPLEGTSKLSSRESVYQHLELRNREIRQFPGQFSGRDIRKPTARRLEGVLLMETNTPTSDCAKISRLGFDVPLPISPYSLYGDLRVKEWRRRSIDVRRGGTKHTLTARERENTGNFANGANGCTTLTRVRMEPG